MTHAPAARQNLCLSVIVVMAAMIAVTPPLKADAVRLGGFWLEDITVQGILDGQLVYTTAAGADATQPMARVEALRLNRVPQLGQAYDAMEAGNYAQAAEILTALRREARDAWLNQLAGKLLVESQDRSNRPAEAAQVYLELATAENIHPWFVSRPPLESVRQADDAVKRRIHQRLTSARRLPREGPVAQMIAPLAALVRPADAETPAVPVPANGMPTTASRADLLPPEQSQLVLPLVIYEDNDATSLAITALLQRGQFAQAAELADQQLLSPLGLSRKLYQQGMARLALADRMEDAAEAEKMYKNAGLSFMRVIAYFPRSAYLGPSLVEAGYVHQRIGRLDLANKLLERAINLIDEDDNPRYAERLANLIAGEVNPQ